jgi:hypothetical protein
VYVGVERELGALVPHLASEPGDVGTRLRHQRGVGVARSGLRLDRLQGQPSQGKESARRFVSDITGFGASTGAASGTGMLCMRPSPRCAPCGLAAEKRDLVVDHCHETGRVRGLAHVTATAPWFSPPITVAAMFQAGQRAACGIVEPLAYDSELLGRQPVGSARAAHCVTGRFG